MEASGEKFCYLDFIVVSILGMTLSCGLQEAIMWGNWVKDM
jgi:hypothetical protein